MAKLIMITGPQAVGKMTVGQELCKITNLKLFHNHITIDLVSNFYSYDDSEGRDLIEKIRFDMFDSFAQSNLEGVIFTCVVNYDTPSDMIANDRLKELFESYGGEFYYVELQAPLSIRKERNITDNRLHHKPSKRNLNFSEKLLMKDEERHRQESMPNEIPYKNYLKIDNSSTSAIETAQIIKKHFNL